ncbi:hypothetical protein [Tautonia plasticadhaerens]|uniref:Uncharacterized protein n=1 Tax=Tautonia plasticadhaerens TaxID=2527974 RepID=A0A518H3I9_9BACT|nr:hypothetical protein [Tautonia plasticadhaerens]QDV35415.1 hypothetical protein ElP_33180 [Tautonia plasticadhaerens]
MTRYLVAGMLLPASLTMAYLILRRPIREICEEVGFEKARQRFRQQRERLEARFLVALGRLDPEERERWEEDADWCPEVAWARDRKTRTLNALVAVRFAPPPFTDLPPPFATALFEYVDGRWTTDGQWFDDMRPDEAIVSQRRLEPVVVSRHRTSHMGDAAL